MKEFPDIRISVVIPAYNRAHTITKTIQSALSQTYPVSEIIVVDDGSSDNTEQVVKAIDDDRIRYFRLDKNRGASGARNHGVAQARYEMIAFLDSDDTWRPDKLEKQIAYLDSHKQCRIVYCALVRHYPSWDQIIPDMESGRKLEGDKMSDLLYDNTVSTPTIVMQKDLFDEIGGFDESLRRLQDWDLAIKCYKLGFIGFVPEVLVDAPLLDDALTSNMDAYFESRCKMMQKYRQDYLTTGTFNIAVTNILELAQKFNMLDKVQAMLLRYISS